MDAAALRPKPGRARAVRYFNVSISIDPDHGPNAREAQDTATRIVNGVFGGTADTFTDAPTTFTYVQRPLCAELSAHDVGIEDCPDILIVVDAAPGEPIEPDELRDRMIIVMGSQVCVTGYYSYLVVINHVAVFTPRNNTRRASRQAELEA